MKLFSRRHFTLGLLSTASLAATAKLPAQATESPQGPALPIPQLIDAGQTNGIASFSAQKSQHEFVAGMPSDTHGYSASFLGPVIRVKSGQSLQIKFKNELDVETSVHWHGLFVPSELDGGPHIPVAPGATWEPTLPIKQAACTAWFHPHPHGDTARQVYMGLAGMIIVDDEHSADLSLPAAYGVDDIPLVLQDRNFDEMGMMTYDDSPMAVMHGSRGDHVIVNGAILPVAKVPKGLVRFRLLNGANARNFVLSFEDGREFQVIAGDNGFLAGPVATDILLMAPGERYEIVVDFSDGKPVSLQSLPDNNGRFGTGMIQSLKARLAAMTSEAEKVMSIVVDPNLKAYSGSVPEKLANVESAATAAGAKIRKFTLDSMMMANMPMMQKAGQGGMMNMDHSKMGGMAHMGGMGAMGKSGMAMGMKMAINGKSFDMARIDADPALGSTEIWEIAATEMAHPFHIHGASFRVLESDGAAPPAYQDGWKDTVLVNQKSRLAVKFGQRATASKPFMFHCHILEHEDAGMMAQYNTV